MFLFNTGGVALVAAALLILMVVLVRKWKGHSHGPGQNAKAIIVFGPYIALVIVIGNIMLGDLQRPSTVDVAPFLALEDIDVGDADGIIDKLKSCQDELGDRFEVIDTQEAAKGCLYFPENSIYFTAAVHITLYEHAYPAIAGFEEYRVRYSAKTAYEYVNLSDNIEALLFNSRVNRADGLGWLAISDRDVMTVLRAKNMVVVVSESKRDGKDIGQASNKAIEKLCGVLAD